MLRRIKHRIKKKPSSKKRRYIFISLGTGKGLEKIFFEDIVYCSGARSYIEIHLSNKQILTVSFNLSDFQRYVPPELFFRIHKSFIVNIDHIKKYITRQVVMDNGDLLAVAEKKLNKLLEILPILKHGKQ
jgi:two-component system LytT family response regulator